MTVFDRTIHLLMSAGIPITENELIGIRTADGLYDDANKWYLVQFDEGKKLKSDIAYVLH